MIDDENIEHKFPLLETETNSFVYNKQHRLEIANKTRKCAWCPPHGGENSRLNGKTPKPDKYKNKR